VKTCYDWAHVFDLLETGDQFLHDRSIGRQQINVDYILSLQYNVWLGAGAEETLPQATFTLGRKNMLLEKTIEGKILFSTRRCFPRALVEGIRMGFGLQYLQSREGVGTNVPFES
jgi:hypothetical protein